MQQLLQFGLEEHLEIMCSEAGEEMEEFMTLPRDEFISAMLRMHAANSSRKWRLMINTQKWINQTNLRSICRRFSLLDKYYWSGSSLIRERSREVFCQYLKTNVFREEIYSRTFETCTTFSGSQIRVVYISWYFGKIRFELKNLEPRKKFSKDRKVILYRSFKCKKRGKSTFSVRASRRIQEIGEWREGGGPQGRGVL